MMRALAIATISCLCFWAFGAFAQDTTRRVPAEVDGCVYLSGAATLTDQQTQAFQCDSAGYLKVTGTLTPNGTTQPIAGTSGGCTPYHLAGGTTASTNSTSIKSTAGNLCDITPINTTTTIYYLKIYDSSTAPTCSSATNLKHVYPIPPASAAGGAGGIVRQISLGESYSNGIGFCVTASGTDAANDNAATGVFIEASYK